MSCEIVIVFLRFFRKILKQIAILAIIVRMREFTLTIDDLAESKEFEELCNILRQFTGIVVGLVHPDGKLAKLLCNESDFNPLCRLIGATSQGRDACQATDRFYANRVMAYKTGIHYFCHAGLVDFAVPVFIENRHIATISCGQILAENPSEKGFRELRRRLEKIPYDPKQLRKAYFNCPYMSAEKTRMLLRLLSFFANYFCEMGHRLHTTRKDSKYPEIQQAKDYIKDHFSDKLDLTEVAENVGLAPTYFSYLFTKVAGVNYSHYLNKLRLGEAKKLLKESDWSITKISLQTGFSSLPYFNQVFKKFENCSPTQYRVKLQSEITTI